MSLPRSSIGPFGAPCNIIIESNSSRLPRLRVFRGTGGLSETLRDRDEPDSIWVMPISLGVEYMFWN